MSSVYREVWTGELVKALNALEETEFFNRIPSYDRYVSSSKGGENQSIHLIDVGADPKVLFNNTTYPIDISNMSESDISISLNKYTTEVTAVSDDELYAITYDKIGEVVKKHAHAIAKSKFARGLHALAPAAHTKDTPVLKTTGAAKADGKKALRPEDIIELNRAFDKAQIPPNNRILVLSAEHYNDLLTADQRFALQYMNIRSGEVLRLYGFDVYKFIDVPLYGIDGKKKAYGAPAEAKDAEASVAFYAEDMFKASGMTKMYYHDAKTSPQYQRNLVNFRHYFILLPKKQRSIGALYSA